MSTRDPEISSRALLWVLVALLLLAGLSLALRFAHLGSSSFPVALGIATVKAVLVLLFFMEILAEKPSVRFAFAAGLSMFALLMTLLVADILTRTIAPLEAPPGTAPRYHG
jgi:cytochrome c oxidase subunit 4